jgi:hypothetical protein
MDRELSHTPEHFIRSSTPLTIESRMWILESLQGRFSTHYPNTSTYIMNRIALCPSFEDPQEAVFYELKWG